MSLFNKKFVTRIIILVVVGSALAFLFFNENGILKFLKLRSELNRLDDDIKKTELRLQTLESEIDSLKTKHEKIERVAREKYNMMLPNENVIRIEEK